MTQNPGPLLGLRTVIYPAPDLAAAKDAFTALLGFGPYFDEPFYVGFEVGGYELALCPAMDPADGPLTYWGVPDCAVALKALVAAGAAVDEDVTEVGDGIRTASVTEPSGSRIGIIENPTFALPASPPDVGVGPGR
jgi:predicted enzyme related to lactoylglutathione lyase